MSRNRSTANLLGLAVLSYLTQGPRHPYELSREMRGHGDERSIKFNHGSLYMVFQQLTKAGLIEPAGSSREGQRPERTEYRLTEAGRTELGVWLNELVAEPRHEYPSYVAALSLIAALTPTEAVASLRRRLEGLAGQRAEAVALIEQADADGVHPLFLVEEEYRRAQLDADIAFTERFIARIEDPEDGWAPQWNEFHRRHTP